MKRLRPPVRVRECDDDPRDAASLLLSLMIRDTMDADGSSLRSDHASQSHTQEPHRRLADVPVLERRRVRQRLALRPPRQPRGRRRRAGVHRSERGHRRGTHQPGRSRHLEGRARRDAAAASFGFIHTPGSAAGMQLAHAGRKGSTQTSMGAAQDAGSAEGWRVDSRRADRRSRSPTRYSGAARARRRGNPGIVEAFRRRGQPRARRRLRRHRSARRPRLPDARVPVAA